MLLTPSHATGAIAIIQLDGDIDAMLAALGIKSVDVGKVVIRNLANVDEGLVARWSETSCLLMPHGGIGVIRALLEAIGKAGIAVEAQSSLVVNVNNARALFPEARSDIEALALFTLTRAASPLAVDLLLQQHALWQGQPPHSIESSKRNDRDIALNRLVQPPLVVMLGQSNIGKSTLTNALAKRNVSVVANEPGTTRDHVGVMLDMAGFVIRFVDTPGLRDNPTREEAAARDIALELSRRADLLLFVGTKDQPPSTKWISQSRQSLTIALQSDVALPAWPHDLAISAKTGEGLDQLVTLVRETLVPTKFIAESTPWRFW